MAKESRLLLTAQQEEYLEWLLTPKDSRRPNTKKAWAEDHGIHFNTLQVWEKRKDFKERWELGVKGLTESPERTQSLLDALYVKGIAGDVRSAELYLKATGQMASQQNINIKTETSVKELSDEDLQALIIEMTNNKINNKPIPDIEIVEDVIGVLINRALLRFDNGCLGSFTCTDAGFSPWTIEQGSRENPRFPHSGQSAYRLTGTRGSLELPVLRLWQAPVPGPGRSIVRYEVRRNGVTVARPILDSANHVAGRVADQDAARIGHHAAAAGADPVSRLDVSVLQDKLLVLLLLYHL